MAKILCIETSTEVCSVAISENGIITSVKEDTSGMNHSKMLTVFIDELLKENQLEATSFDAVAVSEGPGSYTGLRIGVSVAKGFCYGAGIPLIAVSPLQAMTYAVREKFDNVFSENDLFIPMIDARRMEVYCAAFNVKSKQLTNTSAEIVDEHSFSEVLSSQKILFFGNGAEKCTTVLSSENAKYVQGIITSSKNMAKPAEEKFNNREFVDVAYFEPFYLKKFIAIKPKNNVLNRVINNKE
ncbi:MAG: tRNA (adenosine(37)-N6)-threonylcarbamoyltransferase complex dimerization subunit type 1 TsaB [Prolixibacteraceae bacterium]|jgi:tRNA threonylcarbamoyladenosine biosynthesis protein TsaB|nr:tRNA (adenosine(37)-N6)-threonylcarbamoyltransferase complex dimerization subunit type 1 TsaB [Prolixibacteraceae bacterium]